MERIGAVLTIFDKCGAKNNDGKPVVQPDESWSRVFCDEVGNWHTVNENAEGVTRETIYKELEDGKRKLLSDSTINPADGSYVKKIYHEAKDYTEPIAIETKDASGKVTTKDTEWGKFVKRDPNSPEAKKKGDEARKRAALPNFSL